ncbi:Ubiquitin-like modifier hub1 [Escovopsis weberi]|uniref:Ubiquitin-like modifier HUB1 n=1 Tax=Escovopsis weberi TaxID=150374 RepID=A0A0M8N1L0_ESCWE|nr:Ubiquitin-like modifier hub1 [Escovopsis weberi]
MGEALKPGRREDEHEQPKKKKSKAVASSGTGTGSGSKTALVSLGQDFIVVNVNDRLGTKTAIPCLPSDTIAQFKLMLAARIGREPGQIMLRRQGERPFKDPLTLEDYGISNGVQLDLEIDTGD